MLRESSLPERENKRSSAPGIAHLLRKYVCVSPTSASVVLSVPTTIGAGAQSLTVVPERVMSVGVVFGISTVNSDILSTLPVPTPSTTVIVQSLYVPAGIVLKVIVLLLSPARSDVEAGA